MEITASIGIAIPPVLASAMRIARPVLLLLILAGLEAHAAEPGVKLWRISVAGLVAANIADIGSSWEKRELNPLLVPRAATFGRDAALIKIGILGAVIGGEYLLTRRKPGTRFYRVMTYINFGGAAANGAVAIHNLTISGVAQR